MNSARALPPTTSRPGRFNASGGKAAAGGVDFQHQVAAWFATRLLAATPVTGLSLDLIERVGEETRVLVDDIYVKLASGGVILVQAKAGLTLSVNEGSEFSKAIGQFVREYQTRLANGLSLNANRDRLVLAINHRASGAIREHLKSFLERASTEITAGTATNDLPVNDAQRNAFANLKTCLDRHWQKETSQPLGDPDLRALLSLIRVLVLDLEGAGTHSHSTDVENTLLLIKSHVVDDPATASNAWDALQRACHELNQRQSSGDREWFQNALKARNLLFKGTSAYQANIVTRLLGLIQRGIMPGSGVGAIIGGVPPDAMVGEVDNLIRQRLESIREHSQQGLVDTAWREVRELKETPTFHDLLPETRAKILGLEASLVLERTEEMEEAQRLADQAETLCPGSCRRLITIFTLRAEGHEAALAQLPEPDNSDDIHLKASLLLETGRGREALELLDSPELQRWTQAEPQPKRSRIEAETLRLRAWALLDLGRPREALESAHQALLKRPGDQAHRLVAAAMTYFNAIPLAYLPRDHPSWLSPLPTPILPATQTALDALQRADDEFVKLIASPELSKTQRMRIPSRSTAGEPHWATAQLALGRL